MKVGGVSVSSMCAIKGFENIELMLHRLRQIHPKYEVLFAIGYSTGLRVSDVLALRGNILAKEYVSVKEKKTGKYKRVELMDSVRSLVERHIKRYRLAPSDYLVFSRDYERRRSLSRVQAYRVMRAVGADLGFNFIGTHCMRKTYAQSRYRATGDIVGLQKELNHKYLSTTIMYLANGGLKNLKIVFD